MNASSLYLGEMEMEDFSHLGEYECYLNVVSKFRLDGVLVLKDWFAT